MKSKLQTASLVSCAVFAGWIILPSIAMTISGNLELRSLLQILSIALLSTFPFFQVLWFSDIAIKKLNYLPRILGFAATYFVVLLIAAIIGGWVPNNPGAWAGFVGIYVLSTAIFSLAFLVSYKRKAGTYQQALDAFKRGKNWKSTE